MKPRDDLADEVAELRAIGAEFGCSFSSRVIDGYCSGTCPSGPAKVGFLDALATMYARRSTDAREMAQAIRASVGGDIGTIARALHTWVQGSIRFVPEGVETFQTPTQTLELRSGDCDCQVILLAAMARSIGIGARCVDFGDPEDPTHVAVQLWDGAGWCWAETTVAAEWGEEPTAAAARLDGGRADILGRNTTELVRDTAASSRALNRTILAELAARRGLGAAPTPSYGQLVADSVQAVVTEPGLVAELSPQARVATQSLNVAISEGLGTELGKTPIAGLSPTIVDAVSLAATMVVKQVVARFASEFAQEAAGELAIGVSDVIPLIGAIIGVLTAPELQAGGIGPASDDPAERAAYCRGQYAPPVGTGPGQMVMPADLFAPNAARNGFGEAVTSSLGEALRLMTEVDSLELGADKATLTKNGNLLKSLGGPSASASAWMLAPNIGIPASWQLIFRKLRLAMAASYGPTMRAANKVSDGGAALFPIYVDLLRLCWARGHMTPRYAKTIQQLFWDVIHPDVRESGETCFTHETRGYTQARGLVVGWEQTIDPYYAQFKDAAKTEDQIISAAAKAMADLEKKPRIKWPPGAFKPKPKAVPPPKKSARAPAVVGGLAVASAAAGAAYYGRDLWWPVLRAAWRRAVRG